MDKGAPEDKQIVRRAGSGHGSAQALGLMFSSACPPPPPLLPSRHSIVLSGCASGIGLLRYRQQSGRLRPFVIWTATRVCTSNHRRALNDKSRSLGRCSGADSRPAAVETIQSDVCRTEALESGRNLSLALLFCCRHHCWRLSGPTFSSSAPTRGADNKEGKTTTRRRREWLPPQLLGNDSSVQMTRRAAGLQSQPSQRQHNGPAESTPLPPICAAVQSRDREQCETSDKKRSFELRRRPRTTLANFIKRR